jgi:triphosphoribosyl-dephospho-CoA synthase
MTDKHSPTDEHNPTHEHSANDEHNPTHEHSANDEHNPTHEYSPSDGRSMRDPGSRTPAENAELALLLELAGTPKPGNVDRRREYPELRFEHFLAGAVGAREGLELAAEGTAVGQAFEQAVAGMAGQQGGNTQFGCLLLIIPLMRARVERTLTPQGAKDVVAETTVKDAANFYRAFDHVDVAVREPGDERVADEQSPEPADIDPSLDVRRGLSAVPAVRERDLTLLDVMRESAAHDGNAREWTQGFPRTFEVATRIHEDEGPAPDRVARAFIEQLARAPDSLVATQHGSAAAEQVRTRATAVDGDLDAAEQLAEELVAEGINPGTTADIVAAGTYVALERGLDV